MGLLSFSKICRFIQTRGMSGSVKFAEKKASVMGVNINYVESGSGDKSVLLLPGALGTAWTDFKPQIEGLPKLLPNHTIIAWDPPGYGKSIPPERDFSLDFLGKDANYANALMGAIGRSKYSILGWSDGGITGMIIAGTYLESVEKLLIWGSNACIFKEELTIYEGIRDVKKWSPRMREPMEKIYGVDGFAKMWSLWVDCFINIYDKKAGDLCKSEVEKIRAPTLIIHGKKDPMVHPKHIPYLREHIKGSKYYEFSDGKHNVHLRYADEFNKIAANFLLDNKL